MSSPKAPIRKLLAKDLEEAASSRNITLQSIEVRNEAGLEEAFRRAQLKSQAVLVTPEALFYDHMRRIVDLAATYRLPVMHWTREFPERGGLIAYGPDQFWLWRRAAEQTDKVLRGARPADLPIEQPTKLELVVTSRQPGLSASPFQSRSCCAPTR
jgi:putative ABC transport system substrate-binding protein